MGGIEREARFARSTMVGERGENVLVKSYLTLGKKGTFYRSHKIEPLQPLGAEYPAPKPKYPAKNPTPFQYAAHPVENSFQPNSRRAGLSGPAKPG